MDVVTRYQRRACQAANLMRHLPFVRLIGLNGSLVLGTAGRESDIDLLIIAQPGRIYTVRFLTNLLALFLGWRRFGRRVAGRLCLNRYQTIRSLEVRPHNAYHARYFSPLVPLYDVGGVYRAYQRDNRWMKAYGSVVTYQMPTVRCRIGLSHFSPLSESLLAGQAGDLVEYWLKYFQLERIVRDRRTRAAPRGRVRYSDLELCFHPIKD